MDSVLIGCLGFIFMLFLILIGLPIAYAGALVGIVGLLAIGGTKITFHFLGSIPYTEMAYYPYTAIPLYILLGEFAEKGGYAHGLYHSAREWFGKFRGGLAIATIVGGAGLGAVSGSSVASSAILGKICIPEMRKFGYDKSFAAGVVASCSNLSSMIPPSGLMIVYSIFTGQSLGKLLIAGILPGIILTLLFSILIFIKVSFNPTLAPLIIESVSWKNRIISLRYGMETFLIAIIVLVGIYSGIFTAIEAGGAGAFAAFLFTIGNRQLSNENFKNILKNSIKTSVMVLFIIMGIMVFTHFLTLSRVPIVIASFLAKLPINRVFILITFIFLYLFLGMFFDAISIIALTVPVIYPTIITLGYDPIWFGVLVVLLCEIGLITPPVGINCYVIAALTPDISLEEVFKGIIPFIIPNLIMIALLIIFPQIALFLPNLMKGE